MNSTTHAGFEVQIPQQTVVNTVQKCLKMFPDKLRLVQSLSNGDKTIYHSFCMDMKQQSEEDAFFD
jgi:hypothetical protein